MKKLLLATLLVFAPLTSYASGVNEFCETLGKLAGVIAIKRDIGISAGESYTDMVSKGVDLRVASLVTDMAYNQMPYEDAEMVAGVAYLTCIKAAKQ